MQAKQIKQEKQIKQIKQIKQAKQIKQVNNNKRLSELSSIESEWSPLCKYKKISLPRREIKKNRIYDNTNNYILYQYKDGYWRKIDNIVSKRVSFRCHIECNCKFPKMNCERRSYGRVYITDMYESDEDSEDLICVVLKNVGGDWKKMYNVLSTIDIVKELCPCKSILGRRQMWYSTECDDDLRFVKNSGCSIIGNNVQIGKIVNMFNSNIIGGTDEIRSLDNINMNLLIERYDKRNEIRSELAEDVSKLSWTEKSKIMNKTNNIMLKNNNKMMDHSISLFIKYYQKNRSNLGGKELLSGYKKHWSNDEDCKVDELSCAFGKIRIGESMKQTMMRELKEEFRIIVQRSLYNGCINIGDKWRSMFILDISNKNINIRYRDGYIILSR